jgi:hypothetical protein
MPVVESVTGVPALIAFASSRPFVVGALLACGNSFLACYNKPAKTVFPTYYMTRILSCAPPHGFQCTVPGARNVSDIPLIYQEVF